MKRFTTNVKDSESAAVSPPGEADDDSHDMQPAFVLACRILADLYGCPFAGGTVPYLPECSGENGSCRDASVWVCWQKYLLERVNAEPVCRICGCTDYNACPGCCSWVEQDLCSFCAEAALREGNT